MQPVPEPLRATEQRLPITLVLRGQPLQLLGCCGHQLKEPEVLGIELAVGGVSLHEGSIPFVIPAATVSGFA
jgi:hypothetical protein